MKVYVTSINIPRMSTIGYGVGTDEEGDEVTFVGDHRAMRDLGEALAEAEEPIEADVPDFALTS